MRYVIVVLFKYKELSAEEEKKAREEWERLKKEFPKDIRLIRVADHAFGTDYNGFIVFESDSFEAYVRFWKWFKDKVRWYIERTQTFIGIKRE